MRCLAHPALFLLALPAWAPAAAPPRLEFNRDIRPILSENCFQCHGPDSNKREAELRLDREADAHKDLGGYRAIVAGKPDESEVIVRVLSDDPDEVMPPPKSALKLTAREKELLRQWIEQGAPWQEHWSFIKPERPVLPRIADCRLPIADWKSGGDGFSDWSVNPIDAFILKKLADEKLAPSREAAPEQIVRRLTLDLTGLPPTPEEVDGFVRESIGNLQSAIGNLATRLLASPHYGERMALPWLDAARYADTHGYQKDNVRTMWAWRDWVVRAFNDNVPFDRFTLEQLAGDLLPDATLAQRLATGFHRNHRINAEAGAIAEEYHAEYVADRVDTTATVWLGLTMACARCHDHKFDALTQRDYYRLFAFFNNVAEKGVDGAGPSPEPELTVPVLGFEKDIALAEKRVAALDAQLLRDAAAHREEQERWEEALRQREGGPAAWSLVEPLEMASTEGMQFERLDDLSILAGGPNPLNDDHTITLALESGAVSAIRLEALLHETHERGSLARSFDGNFVLSGFEVEVVDPGVVPRRVAVRAATADYEQAGWPVSATLDESGDTGWSVDGGTRREVRTAVFVLEKPIVSAPGRQLRVRLRYQSKEEQNLIGRFRLATTDRAAPALEPRDALPASVIAALADRSSAPQDILARYFRSAAPELAAPRTAHESARRELDTLRRRATTTVMVMNELKEPRATFIHLRGQYDKPGEQVTPGVPASLPALPSVPAPNRLDLARWIVAPENPLTARVAVNRFWQMYFGTGLVKTTEDFGTQGEWPSHPELLDWLATEFVRTGWDVKAMQRLIVTSATYRQSSKTTAALLERDPENRLLARGPRFRLPGPFIRDQALAAGDLLVPRIGGPPVKPYQPDGLWEGVAGINSNTTRYERDSGESLHRRSLYTFWKRAVPPPAMMIFDSADREVCSVKRRLTNTPLQALNLLNDVTYVEAARALAARVLRAPDLDDDARLRLAWRRVLARGPEPHEQQRLTASIAAYRARFHNTPGAAEEFIRVGDSKTDPKLDPAELAAWTTLASVLLNLDETLTKE
jgi:cytochrome c553